MGTNAPSRRPIVGGNWKMNTTLPTAVDLAENLVRQQLETSLTPRRGGVPEFETGVPVGEVLDVEVVLFPPFPNLESVQRVIEASTLQLGSQDVYWEDSGAYTGEVSAPMLAAVGCGWVIVGHSERRKLFGESSEIVNRKLHAVLRHGLQAILAIGETREERHANRTEEICERQLRESLAGVRGADMERVVIAYEPVWAIGTGETATPDQAREAHAYVRLVLSRLYGEDIAAATRIQYGGSVTAQNAAELMAQPGIDGALVGGASLKPADFAAIVRAAASS